MASIFDRLRAWLMGAPAPSAAAEFGGSAHTGPVDETGVEKLMRALSMTRDDELSCAEVFALLDEYAELAATDEEKAAELMPLMHLHLEMCADCHEYYDALLKIVRPANGPPAALA